MELTKEQQLFQQIINEAWENESFKADLMANPVTAIEALTGEKLDLPKGKTLVVRDQTDENTVYINIPAATPTQDVELNEEQLEAVAGGTYDIEKPFIWTPTLPTLPWAKINTIK